MADQESLDVRSRPYAPGYVIPTGPRGMLPWSFVEERMTAARDYCVATVLPTGGPHLTPNTATRWVFD